MVLSTGLTSAPAFTECFSFEKEQQGLPQLTSWVWTSLRRAFKHRDLCTGCKHLFGAFQLSSHCVNCNPDPARLRRRDYKLLVSRPCLASLPGAPGMVWLHNGSSSQPPHPVSFRDNRAAVRSQLCTLRAPSPQPDCHGPRSAHPRPAGRGGCRRRPLSVACFFEINAAMCFAARRQRQRKTPHAGKGRWQMPDAAQSLGVFLPPPRTGNAPLPAQRSFILMAETFIVPKELVQYNSPLCAAASPMSHMQSQGRA